MESPPPKKKNPEEHSIRYSVVKGIGLFTLRATLFNKGR